MKIKQVHFHKFFQQTCSLLANFSLFLHIFLPYLSAVPAFAEDADLTPTPVPTEIIENTPTPEPLVSPEPTAAAETPLVSPEPTAAAETITPIVTETPTETPTPEPLVSPEPTAPAETPFVSPEPTAEPLVSPEPTAAAETPTEPVNIDIGTQAPVVETEVASTAIPVVEKVCLTGGEIIEDTTSEDWIINDTTGISETKENVKLGLRYVYPQDTKVTIIFKCLPADESLRTPLKIQKIKSSELKLPDELGDIGEYAYDITTGMSDGTFEYDVTLPKPDDSTAEVSYIEKSIDDAKNNEVKVDEIKPVEESKVEQQSDTVTATSLDHFTIFFTTGVWPTTSDNGIVSGEGTSQIRWPDGSSQKSGLGFVGVSELNLESLTSSGNAFTLGTLTHYNHPVSDAIYWADLKITLGLPTPKDFTFRVQIDETSNTYWLSGCTSGFQISNTPCDDKVTFPDSISDQIVTVGGIDYTLIIDGFQRTVGGATLDSFITEESIDNSAFLVGHFVPVGRIIVDKVTTPTGDATSFSFTTTGAGYNSFSLTDSANPNNQVLPANKTYSVSESNVSGWTKINANCISSIGDSENATNLELDAGETITCTFTNAKNVASLNVVKNVVPTNDSGQFNLLINGTEYATNIGNNGETGYKTVSSGTVNFSETAGTGTNLSDYTVSYGTGCENGQTTLAIGESKTCTITNTRKVYCGDGAVNQASEQCDDGNNTNGDGCSATCQTEFGSISGMKFHDLDADGVKDDGEPGLQDWNIELGSMSSTSGYIQISSTTTDTDGNYAFTNLLPSLSPAWYVVCEEQQGGWEKTAPVTTCHNITLDPGRNISNADFGNVQLGTMVVKKVMVGGTDSFDFTGNVQGTISTNNGILTVNNVSPGTHTSTEAAKSGWDLTSISCDDNNSIGDVNQRKATFNIESGETVTCTFTNKIKTGTLKVIKSVVNDEDGTDSARDFQLYVKNSGLDVIGSPFYGSESGTILTLEPGSYNVSEDSNSDYTTSFTGDCLSDGTVTVAAGTEKVCTVVNDDKDYLPSIEVTKTAGVTSVNEPGANVTFTFTVKNTSANESVTISELSDSDFATLSGDDDCKLGTVLTHGASCTFDYTTLISGDASDSDHQNTFTGKAKDNENNEASDTDDATVGFDDVKPDISVTKSASPVSVPETGGNVTFTFVVSNIGTESVTLTTLSDSIFGDLNGQGDCATGGLIPVGGSYTCSIAKFLASDSLVNHTNTVTAIGTDNDGSTDTATDNETVKFDDVPPTIDVTKTVDDNSIPETGQDVTFTIEIKNTSAEEVTVYSVVDSVFGDLLDHTLNPTSTCITKLIASGATYTCSVTKFLTSDSLVDHYNEVTVTAGDNDGYKNATDDDDETVKFEDVKPNVSVTKDANVTLVPETGKDVKFTYVVYNNNEESATIYALSDDKFGPLAGDADCKIGTVLAGKSSCSFEVTFAVPAGTAGTNHTNVFSATLTDNDDNSDTNTDDATVTYIGAKISFTQLTATNNINDGHTFTVTVMENPGDGWAVAPGELVSFTLVNNTAGANFVDGLNTCTTNINGQCLIKINSASPGTVEIHASVDAGVLSYTLHRETDGTLGSSINATKTYEAGKIIIQKETLPDGDTTQSFQFNPSWSESNFSLKDGESKDSGWLAPETYNISEIGQTGWDLTNVTCNDQNIGARFVFNLDFNPNPSIILDPGEIVTCTFTNTQRGSVAVTKFEDLDSDGRYDKDTEETLSGWTVNLSGETKVTDIKGATFDQLTPNIYTLSETIQPGWSQTNIYCNNEVYDREETSIDNDNSHEINLSAGQNLVCFIGNQRLNPQLTISKSNDVSGDKTPGSSVGFKIVVKVLNNDVDNLIVTDLPSEGFVYQTGTYKVISSRLGNITGNIDPPLYQSPGKWLIGDVKAGDVIELSYLADISSDQQPGTYKDLAYARGVAAYDNKVAVIATSEETGRVTNNLVGTEVPIVTSTQNSISAGVEREVEGEVLGASTELPATGADTIWLLISAFMFIIGLAFIKKSTFKFATLLFLTIFSLFFVGGVKAVNVDSLSVRLEQPKSPTNLNDLKLTFVALDLNNKAINIKCYKKGPSDGSYSQFGADIPLTAPGNTDQCETNSSILSTEGTYNFYVTANGEESNIVSLDYKTSGPGTPTDYRKEWLNGGCDYKIHFKTADDGGKTDKVELYRADITDFILDSGSRVASINIDSNQESTITNTVPDCSKSYYYVLRAFDDAGNGSGTIGDTITITKTSTTIGTTTTTSGAIPVTNATISPEEESTLLTGTPAPEDLATDNEEGTVLGTIDSVKSFLQKSWLPLSLGLIGLFAIIRYALKKKKRSSYR